VSLHQQITGNGAPLCLLHGWALNSHVWDQVTESLQQHYQVNQIDLPGHGKSSPPASGEYTLDSLTAEISKLMEQNTTLVGWSLGGLIAMNIAARHPGLVKKLILVASSPQFTASSDWDHAVGKSVFDGFSTDLGKNYRKTILRFLAIQTLGCEQNKPAIRKLREKVFINGEPHLDSLEKGLRILKNSNLRQTIATIRCPTLIILGEKDTLVPKESGLDTQSLISNSQLSIVTGAGHAPFLSHPADFINLVNDFTGPQA
jgi:pimeloyl-[acyl-carrier protein] methyl ester esterase